MPTALGFTACQTSTYGWPVTSTCGLRHLGDDPALLGAGDEVVDEHAEPALAGRARRCAPGRAGRRRRRAARRRRPRPAGRGPTPARPARRRACPRPRSGCPTATRAVRPCTATDPRRRDASRAPAARPPAGPASRRRRRAGSRPARAGRPAPCRAGPRARPAPCRTRRPPRTSRCRPPRRRARGRPAPPAAAASAAGSRGDHVRAVVPAAHPPTLGAPGPAARLGSPVVTVDAPRSALLASWGTAFLAGEASLPELLERVTALDDDAVVTGLAPDDLPVDRALARLRASGVRRLRLVLPAPGDVLGLPGPGPFTARRPRRQRGRARAARGRHRHRPGARPSPPTARPSTAPSRPCAGPRTTSPSPAPTPARSCTTPSTTCAAAWSRSPRALRDLDVARWRPELAGALQDLRRQARAGHRQRGAARRAGPSGRARCWCRPASSPGVVAAGRRRRRRRGRHPRRPRPARRRCASWRRLVRRARVAAWNAYGQAPREPAAHRHRARPPRRARRAVRRARRRTTRRSATSSRSSCTAGCCSAWSSAARATARQVLAALHARAAALGVEVDVTAGRPTPSRPRRPCATT